MAELWGVLLAAGRGERFGTNKLMQTGEDGTPLAVAAARALLRALPDSVAVVRPDDAQLIERLAAEGIGIVKNPQADRGMGDSLACGVRALPPTEGIIVALADMPWIRVDTVRRVAAALHQGARLSAPVYRGSRGHPVGFHATFRASLESLTGDSGARSLLDRHHDELVFVEVDDPGCLRDVDRPEDLLRA